MCFRLAGLILAMQIAGCGDNSVRCEAASRPQDLTCVAAILFASRTSTDLLPRQEDADLFYDRWQRAVRAEPILANRVPQTYRTKTPYFYTLTTTNLAVVNAWTNGTLQTGDPRFDSITAQLVSPSVNSFWHANGDGSYVFGLAIESLLNEEQFQSRLLETSTTLPDVSIAPRDDGVWIWNGGEGKVAQVDFTFGWGDCFVACTGFHRVRAVIAAEGNAVVFDLGGDPLPDYLALSPNTKPLPPSGP